MTEKRIPFVPADDLSKLWRAIIEFDMLAPGDRILIGLSGGKDSMFLTAALAEIKKYSPIPFDLACYTVNAMFAPDFPKEELEAIADVILPDIIKFFSTEEGRAEFEAWKKEQEQLKEKNETEE